MKKKMKHLMTITTIIIFSIISIASLDDESNGNNDEGTVEQANEGNTYDYIEDYHNGWKIFHSYHPEVNTSECDSRKCDWCGNYYEADRIDFNEIPNTSDMAQMVYITQNGNKHMSSLEGSISGMFAFGGDRSIDDALVDTVNQYIYTTWETKCVFDFGNYCSRKCETENLSGF
jgi:hypothetical protein